MAKFRDVKIPQKFASAHASIHSHFKQNRAVALAEWRQLAA